MNDGKYEEFVRLDNSVVDEVKRIYGSISKGMSFLFRFIEFSQHTIYMPYSIDKV